MHHPDLRKVEHGLCTGFSVPRAYTDRSRRTRSLGRVAQRKLYFVSLCLIRVILLSSRGQQLAAGIASERSRLQVRVHLHARHERAPVRSVDLRLRIHSEVALWTRRISHICRTVEHALQRRGHLCRTAPQRRKHDVFFQAFCAMKLKKTIWRANTCETAVYVRVKIRMTDVTVHVHVLTTYELGWQTKHLQLAFAKQGSHTL